MHSRRQNRMAAGARYAAEQCGRNQLAGRTVAVTMKRISTLCTTGFLLTALGVSGCTGNEPQPQNAAPVDTGSTQVQTTVELADLLGGTWRPIPQYEPESPVASSRNSPETGEVVFGARGRWTGSDGCNVTSGRYTLTSDALSMTGSTLTDVGCANMLASDYLDGTTLTLNASGTRLAAKDSEGQVVIEYRRHSVD